MVAGWFTDLCVPDVAASAGFYRSLLELDVVVDHGWYAELGLGGRTVVAFVRTGHSTVPADAGHRPAGVLVSFEVDDAESAWARVDPRTVVVALTTELGQRHFMVRDPAGAVVDVIERVPMSRADVARLARLRREHVVASGPC